MVLSKINNKSPFELANILLDDIKKKDELIDDISVVKPGFINIKYKPLFWTNFVKEIIILIETVEYKFVSEKDISFPKEEDFI